MSSKHPSFLLSVIRLQGLVLLICLGCGLRIGEKAPQEKAPTYSGDGYKCVSEIPQTIERYFQDDLEPAEINEFMNCLQKSLVSFGQLTRGQSRDSYAPEEIQRFLNSLFLRDNKITDELLKEFMVIKRFMAGGSVGQISRPELQIGIEILDDIRREALRLKPHVRYLNSALVVKQSPVGLAQNLKAAEQALNAAIDTFTARLNKSQNSYDFESMEGFLREFRKFIGWEDHFRSARNVRTWVELVRALKDLTVSPESPEAVRIEDWTPLLRSAARIYLSYVQYQAGISKQPLLRGVGLQNIIYLAQEIFGIVEEAIDRQPAKTISFRQIGRAVDAVATLGWLPTGFRAISVNLVIRMLVTKVFGDTQVSSQSRSVTGITLGTVASVRENFFRWAYIQMRLSATSPSGPGEVVPKDLEGYQISPGITANLTPYQADLSNASWTEFLRFVQHSPPMFAENQDRVYMVPRSDHGKYQLTHGFHNLSYMNVLRSLAMLVYRGYAKSSNCSDVSQCVLKKLEVVQFYEDFFEIGVDLGWFDPRVRDRGERAFNEGNLFTFTADGLGSGTGDDTGELTLREGVDLLAYLYSSATSGSRQHRLLLERCTKGPDDYSGIPMIATKCVERELPQILVADLDNMPNMSQFMGFLDPELKQEMVRALLEVSISFFSPQGYVERGDLCTLTAIILYAESLMVRADQNQDGYLDQKEVAPMLSIFHGLIRRLLDEKLAKLFKESEVKEDEEPASGWLAGIKKSATAYVTTNVLKPLLEEKGPQIIFEFILIYQRLPKFANGTLDSDDLNKLRDLISKKPEYKLDRYGLIKVFNTIIVGSRPTTDATP